MKKKSISCKNDDTGLSLQNFGCSHYKIINFFHLSLEGGYDVVKSIKSNEKTSMTMIVDGHEVSLHFAKEPDIQLALKIKQALLGTFLATKD